MDAGVLATGRVVALVPAIGRSRMHLEIEVGGIAESQTGPGGAPPCGGA